MRRARSHRLEGVGDRAAGVVVTMKFDVAADDRAHVGDQLAHLGRAGDANRIGQPHTVDTRLIGGGVDAQEVGLIAPEGVFA